MAGRVSAESNALSKRIRASKGFSCPHLLQQIPFLFIFSAALTITLYIGHTHDVDERVNVHNAGRGALWTACRRPVVLVYWEPHSSEEHAIARERQLKRWTHAKKIALIDGDQSKLKALAKRRTF